MSNKKLVIIGAGDLGREIMYAALDDVSKTNGEGWLPIAFVNTYSEMVGGKHEGLEVLSVEQAAKLSAEADVYFINSITSIERKKDLINGVISAIPNIKFAKVIHKSALIMPNTIIEEGAYIAPRAVVAISCHIKRHVILNINTSIGHDCIIEEYSTISPGCILSGRTLIGRNTFLGSGVITYPKIRIGENCVLSAHAVASRDIADGKKIIAKPNTMALPV